VRTHRPTWRLRHFVASGTVALALTLAAGFVTAQTPVDEEAPWPRVRTTNGHTVTLHLPQVESWTSNSFQARAAVGLKMAGAKSEWLGVIWLAAHGSVDRSNRIVMLDGLEITKARFPEAPDGGSNALAVLRDVVPSGARTVSLDYLITALGFAQASARQGPRGLKNTPPEIVWATNRTVLVLMDGEPVLREHAGLDRVRQGGRPVLPQRRRTLVHGRIDPGTMVVGANAPGRSSRLGAGADGWRPDQRRRAGAPDPGPHASRGIADDERPA
jgi:hypothetical protein